MLRIPAILGAFLLGAPAVAQPNAYAVGQVWEYRTAPQDQGSLIRIQEIEPRGPDDEPVFHISMINIHAADGGLIPEIQHLPVSRETLDSSVTRLSDSDAGFPDYRAGLEQWRQARGGVFTITLAEIGDVIRQSIVEAQQRRQQEANLRRF